MKTAFIIHAPEDRAAAAGLTEALENAGVGAAARPLRGDRYEIETLAVRMRGADVAVALLSDASARLERVSARSASGASIRSAAGRRRLTQEPSIAGLPDDREILVGTPYEERGDDLLSRLEDSVFIGVASASDNGDDDADSSSMDAAIDLDEPEGEAVETPFRDRAPPLVERVRKELATAPVEKRQWQRQRQRKRRKRRRAWFSEVA